MKSSLFPHGADPVAFYRSVIFPLKARIDLAYYQNGSLISDIGWIIRCVLVVVRLRSVCPPEFLAKIRIVQDAADPESLRIPGLAKFLVNEYQQALWSKISRTPEPLAGKQHSGTPVSWRIANRATLLLADDENEPESNVANQADPRNKAEPVGMFLNQSLACLSDHESSHKIELV